MVAIAKIGIALTRSVRLVMPAWILEKSQCSIQMKILKKGTCTPVLILHFRIVPEFCSAGVGLY